MSGATSRHVASARATPVLARTSRDSILALLATPLSSMVAVVVPVVAPVESPPFPFETASADRVHAGLVEAFVRHAETLVRLRSAVNECTRHLRSRGMTPEAMLVTMKAFVRHTAIPRPSDLTAVSLSDPLMERIVEWCIIEYFRES